MSKGKICPICNRPFKGWLCGYFYRTGSKTREVPA